MPMWGKVSKCVTLEQKSNGAKASMVSGRRGCVENPEGAVPPHAYFCGTTASQRHAGGGALRGSGRLPPTAGYLRKQPLFPFSGRVEHQ